MQRRIIFALVATAVASIVLVGAGVLVFAQVGATAQTEEEVLDQLDVLTNLVAQSTNDQGATRLDRLRRAFDFSQIDFVVVSADGTVRAADVAALRRPAAADLAVRPGNTVLTLEPGAYDRLVDGESVIASGRESGGADVRGIRLLDLDARVGATTDGQRAVGLMVGRDVVTVAGEARVWFVVSAAAVLAGAVLAAWLLSRRLTGPLADIERATAAIAAGDLGARVPVVGDDELAQLGHSVNRMAADLERSRALDQQFLMSVSHDLRTPLTAIGGYAEALRDGAVSEPAQAGEIIANHSARLERLVRDLLDLAKLDANRFRLHPVPLDLGVVAGRTIAGLTPSATRHGLTLRCDATGDTTIEADPDRVAQVIGNLVENALTFATTTVVVTVGVDQSGVYVAVADDGPGIPAAELGHVFDRLYTGRTQPTRAENPSGMGLAIVRELTTAMGGSVEAASTEGTGTTMTVRFPVPTAATQPA